ncbi:uncharacterized protein RMCC_2646 [Mycolicibacterium canariasense]|uniref:Uncharacterized protein n=1 Tax=Mycolicibacterium canariasense TaxID=228230 RepID=A0A100WCP7_MYCCR|nr:uncharacterized protein RMCC_2646 [Mycolicibacterium canariasense]
MRTAHRWASGAGVRSYGVGSLGAAGTRTVEVTATVTVTVTAGGGSAGVSAPPQPLSATAPAAAKTAAAERIAGSRPGRAETAATFPVPVRGGRLDDMCAR